MEQRIEKIWEWIKRNKTSLLTILSGLIGAIVFILIYGVKVLDVTKAEWIFRGGDIPQHYLGWEFFRKSEWTFQIRTI